MLVVLRMRSKILVVDDEPDMVELISYHLESSGYDVLRAFNGLEAVQLARRHLPDLVVLDLMLAGMDGFTVCEVLRQIPEIAHTPIIMLTALGGQIARFNGLAVGATDFMRKPFSPRDLLHRVDSLLVKSPTPVQS
jgi:two-component system, OmpR family, alkaline phosphatase synthesis response regulator PhoP